MGRTVYWMNVSIDGYIERAAGEHGAEGVEAAPGWVRIDEQLHEHFNQQARGLALLVEGRVVYEMMESAWPAAATDDSLPGFLQEFGERRVFGGDDVIEQLAAIRADTDGAIGVGGATLATALLQAGLLDELLLYVHPAVLGAGRPLFDDLSEPLLCDLLDTADFANGVAMRRYAVQGAGA